jgi:hypothetical protein
MKFKVPNVLLKPDLQELLKKSRKNKLQCQQCHEHLATDIHHVNSNHDDNHPENLIPWCKRCHNEHHDISDNLTTLGLIVRQYYSIQRQRIAMGNRVDAYDRLGYEVLAAQGIASQLKGIEKDTAKQIAKMVKKEPVYAYLGNIKGCGPTIAAALISEIGDPGRFKTISKLWAYAGLAVKDGKSQRRTRGETANWNQNLRKLAIGVLVPQFIKLKHNGDCLGRRLYDQYKAYYTERDGETLTPGHIESRARRKVAKVFMSCLWVAWRTIKGQSISVPYAMTLPGHSHMVTPEDWAGEDWMGKVQYSMLEKLAA